MELRLRDLRRGYVDLVNEIRLSGKTVSVRGMETRELTGATLQFDDVTKPMLPVGVGRRVNTRLAAVEALQLVAGSIQPKLLMQASPHYADVLVNPTDVTYGAYGPRVRPQLREVIKLLRADPTTRQAVLSIWESHDLTHAGDKPCTIGLQFLARDDQLQLHVWMRSQDCWLGVPYDLFMFTQLQQTVARLVGLHPGRYVHHVTSLHLYERDYVKTTRLTDPTQSQEALPDGVHPATPTEVEHSYESIQINTLRLLRNIAQATPHPGWLKRNGWYASRIEELHEAKVTS